MGRTLFLHRDVAARSQHAEPPAQMDAAKRPPFGRRPPGKATLRHDPARPALDAPEGKGIHMLPRQFSQKTLRTIFFFRSARQAQRLQFLFLLVRF